MANGNDDGAKVLGVLLLVAAFIGFLVFLSEFFFIVFIVMSVLTVVVLIIELYGGEIKISPFLFLGAIIALIISLITGQLAVAVAGSAIGQASLETSDAMNQMEESLSQVYTDIINEQCKILNDEQCGILKTYAKTAKTVQELQGYATKLGQASKLLN